MSRLERTLILGLDTAFDQCSAALFDPRANDGRGKTVGAVCETIGRGHAERLPGVIDRLFADAGGSFADIAKLAVTIGPGSFTGVRVGVSAARGYALALGAEAIGITTLHAMAEAVRRDAPVLAIHDAKRGEVYALIMGADGAILRAPEALAPDMLAAFIEGAVGPDLSIDATGSGAQIALETLGADRVDLRDRASHIDIETMTRLAAFSKDPLPVKPLYLRSADAKPPARIFSLFAEKT